MNRAVPDFGPYTARLLIVGEAGGHEEGRLGRPFVGATGRKVRELVAATGLDPERDARYANVIPIEMPTLPSSMYAMQAIVRQHWHEIEATLLRGEHAAVLAYGRAAAWRLTGQVKITDVHGSVSHIEVGGRRVPCVSSIHPASVMRSKIEAGWELVRAATERACRYASGVEFDVSRQAPTQVWDYTGARVRALHNEALCTGNPVALDTEYSRETLIPFVIGLSCDGESVVSVAPNGDTIPAVRHLLDDARVTKLMHHAPADLASLATIGITVRPPLVDTLMLYATVFPDLPVGLGRVALHLLDHWHAWKTMAHDDPAYNAIDVAATWRVYQLLHARMTADDLWPVWRREARHVGVLCMAMEARGLAVDTAAQRAAVAANAAAGAALVKQVGEHVGEVFARRRAPVELRLAEIAAELATVTQPRLRKDRDPVVNARVGALRVERTRCEARRKRWMRGFDLGNNDHLRWLLYDGDGFKLPVQRVDGRPTANADAIAKLLALKRVQESAPIRDTLVAIKEYQHLRKMTTTFLLWDEEAPSRAIDAQGFAHPEYRAFGTGTGRLAGGPDSDLGDRSVNEYAYNAMNIPEETRLIYVPHPATFTVTAGAVAREAADDDSEDFELAADDLSRV